MRKYYLLLLGFLFYFIGAGQSARAQNELNRLISYALEHSHEVKKAGLQIQESDYRIREARGQGLPQLDGSASYSLMMIKKMDIPAEFYQMVGSSYAPILDKLADINKLYTASAGMQVTQLIYSQSYWVGLQAAKKANELYSILKSSSEESIIEEVANGYYQAGSLMLQQETINRSLSNLNELYRVLNLNYKNDMVKETEVSRLKVTITNLEVTRKIVENGLYSQMNYLKALAGMPLDTTIKVDTASIVKGFREVGSVAGFQVDNVPSYKALLKQSELVETQLKLTKATYYPTLAAFGKFSYSSYNTTTSLSDWNPMTTVGLNLSIPIFTSGVNRSKMRQAYFKQEQLNEDILQTRDMLKIQYDNAISGYQTSKRLLDVQRENRELAQKVYAQTLMQYHENMASLADLLNVNSDYLQADNSYNQQILNCKVAEIKILKASGNLKSLSISK